MDSAFGTTLLFGIFLILISGISTDGTPFCEKSNACQCTLTNGTVINLESLASSNSSASFRQQYEDDSWVTYNPCKPFNGDDECKDAAVCLEEKGEFSSVTYTSLFGKQDTALWTKGEGEEQGITISYKYNDRNFKVSLVCEPTAKISRLNVTNITNTNTIVAVLTSECACLGSCAPSVNPSEPIKHTISTGSILLILFFTLVFLYLVGGIIYNKIVNGATGRELIPNVEFWIALPRLLLDGVAFTCNCCGKRKSTPGYDNV